MVSGETFREFAKYGFAGIIAGILLAFFLTEVRADQRSTRTEHQGIMQEAAAMKDISGQSHMSQQQILYVLTTMCINQAKNNSQRGECVKMGGYR